MDPLDQFFDGPRAARAFVMTVEMRSPWAIEVEDEAALTVVLITRGAAMIGDVTLREHDVALVRGPAPYRVAGSPDAPTCAVIGPGQVCTTPDGVALHESFAHGVRRWGNSRSPDTEMIVGAYAHDGAIGRLVSLSLPPVARVPRTPSLDAISNLLRREVGNTGLGQQAILDRLLDTLVVSALREWAASRADDLDTSWLTTRDPVARRALEAMHSEPQTAWTVASLAALAHVSRATFAARFRSAVGSSPVAYLNQWRLALAAERLVDPSLTVAHVGRTVGYENAFAFSTAFKRQYGQSPSEFRSTTTASSGVLVS
ncbi:AraC family transcriptional regulator [Microbacterium sp. P06]|uniref:AraC family transcriptional regulator n=1 Tax=Microbacterium sp. P06 TaxID=3366949 RepID=UPI00374540B6